ncbi:hypothetical protein ES708_32398 [subsurface metagenome]
MKYIKILMLFWVMLSFYPTELRGQNDKEVTLESLVYDRGGNPVADASVSGEESNIVQYTDLSGKFTITVPVNSMLFVSANGFKSQAVKAIPGLEKIVLEKDSVEQLVNVAYKL